MAKAAPQSQELNINLLQKEEAGGTVGEVIQWVLTVGRYLIIAAEVIALIIFGLGIKFSADKNDLKNSISLAQSDLDQKSSCKDKEDTDFCEDRFRTLQNKFNLIKAYRSGQFSQAAVLEELLKRLPPGVLISNLSLDGSKLTLTGSFATSTQLQTLINSFNTSEKITALDIGELNSPTISDPNFSFKATAEIDKTAFTQQQTSSLEGSN